jgi:hypothetical protein
VSIYSSSKCQWKDRLARAACGVHALLELADHQRLTDWEPNRVSDEGISAAQQPQQQQEPDLGGRGAQHHTADTDASDCRASLLQQPAPPPSVTPATPSGSVVAALSPLIARIPRREFFPLLSQVPHASPVASAIFSAGAEVTRRERASERIVKSGARPPNQGI